MNIERLPFALTESGIARGTLTEFSGTAGSGKTETVLDFIASNKNIHTAWIEHAFTVYPTAFLNAGIDLETVLFIEAGQDVLWTALQTMRSGVFGIITLLPARMPTTIEARRLQLAAEKSRTCLIMITEHPSALASWPLSLQISVNRGEDGKPEIRILKARGANAGLRAIS